MYHLASFKNKSAVNSLLLRGLKVKVPFHPGNMGAVCGLLHPGRVGVLLFVWGVFCFPGQASLICPECVKDFPTPPASQTTAGCQLRGDCDSSNHQTEKQVQSLLDLLNSNSPGQEEEKPQAADFKEAQKLIQNYTSSNGKIISYVKELVLLQRALSHPAFSRSIYHVLFERLKHLKYKHPSRYQKMLKGIKDMALKGDLKMKDFLLRKLTGGSLAALSENSYLFEIFEDMYGSSKKLKNHLVQRISEGMKSQKVQDKRYALRVAGGMGGEEVIPFLKQGRDKTQAYHVRLEALRAAGLVGKSKFVLSQKDSEWKKTTLSKEAKNQLWSLIQQGAKETEDIDMRQAALKSAGQIGGEKAWALINKELSKPASLYANDQKGTNCIKAKPDSNQCLKSLPHYREYHVRAAALKAAAEIGGKKALQTLRPFVNDKNPYMREVALLSLARVGGAYAKKLIDWGKKFKDPNQERGVFSSTKRAAFQAEKKLHQLRNRSWDAEALSLKMAGRIGGTGAVQFVAQYEDKNGDNQMDRMVAKTGADILAKITDPNQWEQVRRNLYSNALQIQQIISETGDVESLDLIKKLTDKGPGGLSTEVLREYAGKLSPKEALPHLRGYFANKHENSEVRSMAFEKLLKWQSKKQASRMVENHLRDEDKNIRLQAVAYLNQNSDSHTLDLNRKLAKEETDPQVLGMVLQNLAENGTHEDLEVMYTHANKNSPSGIRAFSHGIQLAARTQKLPDFLQRISLRPRAKKIRRSMVGSLPEILNRHPSHFKEEEVVKILSDTFSSEVLMDIEVKGGDIIYHPTNRKGQIKGRWRDTKFVQTVKHLKQKGRIGDKGYRELLFRVDQDVLRRLQVVSTGENQEARRSLAESLATTLKTHPHIKPDQVAGLLKNVLEQETSFSVRWERDKLTGVIRALKDSQRIKEKDATKLLALIRQRQKNQLLVASREAVGKTDNAQAIKGGLSNLARAGGTEDLKLISEVLHKRSSARVRSDILQAGVRLAVRTGKLSEFLNPISQSRNNNVRRALLAELPGFAKRHRSLTEGQINSVLENTVKDADFSDSRNVNVVKKVVSQLTQQEKLSPAHASRFLTLMDQKKYKQLQAEFANADKVDAAVNLPHILKTHPHIKPDQVAGLLNQILKNSDSIEWEQNTLKGVVGSLQDSQNITAQDATKLLAVMQQRKKDRVLIDSRRAVRQGHEMEEGLATLASVGRAADLKLIRQVAGNRHYRDAAFKAGVEVGLRTGKLSEFLNPMVQSDNQYVRKDFLLSLPSIAENYEGVTEEHLFTVLETGLKREGVSARELERFDNVITKLVRVEKLNDTRANRLLAQAADSRKPKRASRRGRGYRSESAEGHRRRTQAQKAQALVDRTLSSEEERVRLPQVRAAGLVGGEKGFKVLSRALKGRKFVRMAAVAQLGNIGGSEALSVLEDITQNSEDSLMRQEAVKASGYKGMAGFGFLIAQKASSDTDPNIRKASVQALENISLQDAPRAKHFKSKALGLLEELLSDPDPGVKAQASAALDKIKNT